jgi:effector-binding domain-containing protein
VKVAAPVQATGRVKPGELPAAKVARAIYSGPYEGLPSAWGEFDTWIKANGYEPADDLWELYSVGPQSTPDPANWRTELTRPLRAVTLRGGPQGPALAAEVSAARAAAFRGGS